MSKSTNKAVIGIFGLLSISIVLFSTISNEKNKTINVDDTPIYQDSIKLDTFSEANLLLEMYDLNIKHANVVFAQSRLETGNFKSKYFKERHNLFGFRNKNGYIKYDSWQSSVKAYSIWQNKRFKGGNYYKFLVDIKYAEDSTYVNKLKQF